jgi:hypothetical protein
MLAHVMSMTRRMIFKGRFRGRAWSALPGTSGKTPFESAVSWVLIAGFDSHP